MLFLFPKTTSLDLSTAFSSVKITSLIGLAILILGFMPSITLAADGLFGSDRIIEPRLQRQVEEEERLKREKQRQALEARRQQESESRRRFYYGKTEDEKSAEEIAFEENKEYMSYWQRLKFSFQYAESFQDIFDQSLKETTYAPARVTSAFLDIRSGPGRNYPSIYLAEKDELIDFSAIRTTWYQIRTANGHFGWVHMDQLPESVTFEYEELGFADTAKTIATRGTPVDLGFMAGIMSEDPSMQVFLRNRNNHFISTEVELGVSRDVDLHNDFISINVLAHPFNEWQSRPHFLLGLGQMRSTYFDTNATKVSESNFYTKAGIGVTRELSQRLRLRADLSQYAVESTSNKLSHFSQLSIGSAYVWGSVTDPILNRSIGERVSVTDLEMSIFAGSVNLSNGPLVSHQGLRASYHVSEDYVFEAHASQGSDDYAHLGVAIARNLLTSEYMLRWRGNRNFWPTQLYLLAGTGLQIIDEDEQVTLSVGGGLRVNPLKRFAIRLDGREHIVHQQVIGNTLHDKYLVNTELSLGLSYYF